MNRFPPLRTILLFGLLFLISALLATTVHAQEDAGKGKAGLMAEIAYYPSYDKLEFRTSESPFRTGDGQVGLHAECYDNTAEKQILEQEFGWEKNNLGITDRIRPPFEPVEVQGNRIRVVLRRYDLGGLGLSEQIAARGQEPNSDYGPLLANPVRLIANGDPVVAEKGRVTGPSGRGSSRPPGLNGSRTNGRIVPRKSTT